MESSGELPRELKKQSKEQNMILKVLRYFYFRCDTGYCSIVRFDNIDINCLMFYRLTMFNIAKEQLFMLY